MEMIFKKHRQDRVLKKKKKKRNIVSVIISPFRNFFLEMKKIRWCPPKELLKYTIVVIVIASIMAVILYALNLIAAEMVSLLGTLIEWIGGVF